MAAKSFYRPKMIQAVILDVMEYARLVESDLAHLLRRPDAGIYSRTSSQLLINSRDTGPSLGNARYYYHDRDAQQFVAIGHRIACVADIQSAVYNDEFNPLVTAAMLREPETFLTESPVTPITGLKIIELYVTNRIYKGLRWKTGLADVWIDLLPYIDSCWRGRHEEISQYEDFEMGIYAQNIQEETIRRLDNTLRNLFYG